LDFAEIAGQARKDSESKCVITVVIGIKKPPDIKNQAAFLHLLRRDN